MDSILLRPEEAGKLIGQSSRQMYRLVAQKKLKAVYLNPAGRRMVRIRRSDLEEYVANLPEIGAVNGAVVGTNN